MNAETIVATCVACFAVGVIIAFIIAMIMIVTTARKRDRELEEQRKRVEQRDRYEAIKVKMDLIVDYAYETKKQLFDANAKLERIARTLEENKE